MREGSGAPERLVWSCVAVVGLAAAVLVVTLAALPDVPSDLERASTPSRSPPRIDVVIRERSPASAYAERLAPG